MAIQKDTGIERAIAALGGITQTILKTQIPHATLLSYRRRGKVTKYEACRILSEASGVPMDDLAGFVARKTA